MKIDLSEWNEYISDDHPSGPLPSGITLETMQIVTAESFKEISDDDFPTGLRADAKSVKSRLFWRLKEVE